MDRNTIQKILIGLFLIACIFIGLKTFNVADFGKTPETYFRWGDEKSKTFTFDFNKINLKGKYQLRDVWQQKDLGSFNNSFKTDIRHHGVLMLRMYPKK